MDHGNTLAFLVFLTFLFWIIPIILLIIGGVRYKTHRKSSKILLIIAGIWLIVGLGFCGTLAMM